MTLEVVAAPTAGLVDLATFKAHTGFDWDDEDSIAEIYVGAASNYLCGPDGILNRSFREWTYKLTLPCFPLGEGRIRLPKSPLGSVESIAYTDPEGAAQVLAATGYKAETELGRSLLAPGDDGWPDTDTDEVVEITYKAYTGSESGGTVTLAIPQEIKVACLMLAKNLYDQRDTTIRAGFVDNPAYQRLLASHRF